MTYTHRVRLHIRTIVPPTIPFDDIASSMRSVYSQHGILIQEVSSSNLSLTPAEESTFDTIDDSCQWDMNSGEYFDLQTRAGLSYAREVVMFFVNQLQGVVGCGGHIPDQPACFVASDGTRWTAAHELGHVLLGSDFSPVHSTDPTNIMMSPTSSITSDPPSFTDEQVAEIKRSPCCTPISRGGRGGYRR